MAMEDINKHNLLRILHRHKQDLVRAMLDSTNEKQEKVAVKEKSVKELSSLSFSLSHVTDYLNEVEEGLKKSGLCYISFRFITKANLIAGWSPVYFITEVPMSWDMILDVPFIMGSTLKGMIRDSFSSLFPNMFEEERCIFGSGGSAGRFTFFDAYPVEADGSKGSANLLTADLINPHYKNVKNEYEVRPEPIKYVAVKEKVKFKVLIAYSSKEVNECKREVVPLLLEALLYSAKKGLGRRTTRGYGKVSIEGDEVSVACPA